MCGRDGRRQVYYTTPERLEKRPLGAAPYYWDVTYEFRGQQHRMQMTSPPGLTVTSTSGASPGRDAPREWPASAAQSAGPASGSAGPDGRKSGWSSHADYTFGTNSTRDPACRPQQGGEIATYMDRNPSQRIALDSSSTSRVGVVRAALIDAGVPASRIENGAYGDPQRRRDGRVEVLVSN